MPDEALNMIRIIAVLVGTATLAVLLRAMTRLKRMIRFGMDDYLCFASWALLMGMLAEIVLWCNIGGSGSHMKDLTREELRMFAKIFIANQFTYFLIVPCLKVSIVCFYRRLFTTAEFRRVSFGLNVMIAAWGLGTLLACAFQCRPLRALWDETIDGHCFDEKLFLIINGIFNVIMDFAVLALPIPMIWGLHRSWQDKLALSAVFSLGAFACFASIFRIVVLFYIEADDVTYTTHRATLWTHIEPSIGLICSCLPIIRGLFPVRIFGQLRSGNSHTPTSRRFLGSTIKSERVDTLDGRDDEFAMLSRTEQRAAVDEIETAGDDGSGAYSRKGAGETVSTVGSAEKAVSREQ